MKIQDSMKECVAYIATWNHITETYDPKGTVFFISKKHKSKSLYFTYAVTAKHVIQKAKAKGVEKVFIRMNLKPNGLSVVETEIDTWFFHDDESVDLAIMPIKIKENEDHMYYSTSEFADDKFILENEVGVGDEVFITGLFSHHHGNHKNIPIVRTGNIASMPEEKIQTQNYLREAFLIEARSIGGLSGSPVFLNLGIVRKIKGQVKFRTNKDFYNLIGIIHGHFDSKSDKVDNVEMNENVKNVNTGIAIVTPVKKLSELLECETVLRWESNIENNLSK